MASFKSGAAILFLGLICIGQLPTISAENSDFSMIENFGQGERDNCTGTCSCNLVSISCCEQQGNGGCCGNILSDINLLQCTSIPILDLGIAAGIAVLVEGTICDPSTNCQNGACILDLKNILNLGFVDESSMYCCTGVNKEKGSFTCKNSRDKDVLMQCSGKDNTSTDEKVDEDSCKHKPKPKPTVVQTDCCSHNACNAS